MAGSRKLKLTKAVIDKIALPLSGRTFVYDSAIVGLCICLMSSGTRTWYLYRKVNGKPVRLKLGRYPEIPPEAARGLATEAAGRMATGEDIQAVRSAKSRKKNELTWAELFAKYLDEHAKIHKKTWREDQANDQRYLQDWSERPLASFSRPMVAEKHREIGKNATTAANRVLSLVSKVFSFADEAGLWDLRNPCKGIKKFKEKSRDRFIQPSEMPRLLDEILKYPDATLRDFFLICLMTGARRANVFSMAWTDLDEDSAGEMGSVWRIPDTKSGYPVMIALPVEAQSILCDRKKICGPGSNQESDWVFPGRYGRGHLKEPKKAWAKILERSGLKNLKIHDLRRTLGSWQAAAGVSLSIIGKSLGHKTTSATAIYARLNLNSVRESVGSAVAAMMNAGRPQDPGNTTSR